MRGFWSGFSTLAATVLLVCLSACSSNSSSGSGSATPIQEPTTGVVSIGVITGFGSVYVNGVRYDTSRAQISVNGNAASETALRAGQCVQIKGHAQGHSHHADVIRYHNVLEGPISAIARAEGALVAMGQTVLVTSLTSFGDSAASLDDLQIGDVVEVSGMVSSGGEIEATRIDIKPDGGPFDVTGYVSNLNKAGKLFNINALVVDYSTANLDDFPTGEPSDGDLVLVKGSIFNADDSFAALRIELRSDDWLAPANGDEIEVEGFITNFVSPTDFEVSGWPVTTTASTLYEHGTLADLSNNARVEVEGAAAADGLLVALKVKFKQVNEIRILAQVAGLTTADGTMDLLGIQVRTDNSTRFEDKASTRLRDFNFSNLGVGDWVDVRGYAEPIGSDAVIAARIVRIEAANAVRLRGTFQYAVRPDFSILSVPVATTIATRFVQEEGIPLTLEEFFTQAGGKIVEAWGSWNGATLDAERAEIKVRDD